MVLPAQIRLRAALLWHLEWASANPLFEAFKVIQTSPRPKAHSCLNRQFCWAQGLSRGLTNFQTKMPLRCQLHNLKEGSSWWCSANPLHTAVSCQLHNLEEGSSWWCSANPFHTAVSEPHHQLHELLKQVALELDHHQAKTTQIPSSRYFCGGDENLKRTTHPKTATKDETETNTFWNFKFRHVTERSWPYFL